MSQSLEAAVTRHFMDEFYWLLLLPDCHPDFMHGWIADMQRLLLKLPSLHYSILASAAAHMYAVDVSPQMERVALSYYSKAVCELSLFLSHNTDKGLSAEDNYGVLISIILLYIQGVSNSTIKTRNQESSSQLLICWPGTQ